MNLSPLRQFLASAALALTASFAGAQAAADGAAQRLATTTLHFEMFNIKAEVARSPAERQQGLMFRTTMGTYEGMLFVFEAPNTQCFWMRNTLLPLSIAFVADDGTIVNIADMAPRSDVSHCSDKPVRYALEMNQGFFAKRGMAAGSKLRGGPFGN